MTVSEAPSNWLSTDIARVRESINKLIAIREQKAERDAIVAAIKDDHRGKELAAHAELPEVVFAALGVANHCEREAERHPKIMTASPAIQASWFIFDELGVAIPDAAT